MVFHGFPWFSINFQHLRYIPGTVVWLHRVRGHLEAAVVPCTLPPLRRIILDKRSRDL